MIPTDLRPLIHQGDVLERLRQLPEATFQVIVTSIPYWRMRDYGVDGQDGLEETVEAFVARQVEVWRECRRVLRKDGTAWLNVGDTYVGGGRGPVGKSSTVGPGTDYAPKGDLAVKPSRFPMRESAAGNPPVSVWTADNARAHDAPPSGNLKRKDLALVPFRLAIALQDDGWWVREAIIWAKPNGIPEPARGRPVHAHEYILLLATSERYYYDHYAVRQPVAPETHARPPAPARPGSPDGWASVNKRSYEVPPDGMANLRSVWSIAMEPYGGDHFAPYPTEIPRRAILAGSSAKGACATCGAPWRRKVDFQGGAIGLSKGAWFPDRMGKGRVGWGSAEVQRATLDGTYRQIDRGFERSCDHADAEVVPCLILDPYSGSGTTLQVARELGRRSVGLELNPRYVQLARQRSTADTPDILTAGEP